jgi:dTDP-glucose 4,6-dehydratase
MHVLVTGGAGFIGSHFIELFNSNDFPELSSITVLDKLTYAGKMSNIEEFLGNPRITFHLGDICDTRLVNNLVQKVDCVINFAAESHVDRSIDSSFEFINTNVLGTQTLLDACKKYGDRKYLQVSTDEVYGSIELGSWEETSPLLPNSPYAASKAAADLLVRAYWVTHGVQTLITRCSNNFGIRQDFEKLIPNMVQRLKSGQNIQLYGDGKNVRDWIAVEDHCLGIYRVLCKGSAGEVYNIGGGNEVSNLDLARLTLDYLKLPESRIDFVKDRLGHDRRYSVSGNKISELGFKGQHEFNKSLEKTIEWYSGMCQ